MMAAMEPRALMPLGLAALIGCATPDLPAQDIDTHFVLRRAYLHPASQLGEWAADKLFGERLDASFAAIGCEAGVGSLVLHLDARTEGGRGLGELEVLFGTPVSGDLCAGTGEVIIQPFSFRPSEDGEREPQVSGPVFLEGRTLDGRINLGDFQVPGVVALGALPRWWSLSAEVEGSRARPGSPGEAGLRLVDAEARTVWPASALALQLVEGPNVVDPEFPPDTRALSGLVAEGYQPGVDLDGDGLERIELVSTSTAAAPGAVARCVDGDGVTVIEGEDCTRDPRIVDGYETVLLFRLDPVRVRAR